ncbi:MAG: hypothetical protein J6A15_06270 [Clostridia bacterium]|nr:hypothetical protein [Clostridia bacterium]
MCKKKEKITFTINMMDVIKHTRSPFANTTFTGCGAHKSKKDYNRQAQKLATKKALFDY